jgi:hypothetical protein
MFFFVLAAIDIKSEEVSINRQRGAFGASFWSIKFKNVSKSYIKHIKMILVPRSRLLAITQKFV